jgi:hypothetical protein
MFEENFVDSVIEEATEEEVVTEEATTETKPIDETPAEDTTPAEESTPEVAEEQATTAEQKLTLKFNHETKEVSTAEAIALAQKGLLYDQDNVSETMKWLKNIVKENGYSSVGDYIKAVNDAMANTKAKTMADEKNIPEAVAREIIERDVKIEQYETEKADRDSKAVERERLIEEIDDFRKAYPDADAANLPHEVLAAKTQNPNVPLKYLYAAYREKQLETEMAVKLKQQQNEQSSTPSLSDGDVDTSTEVDDLLNSIFTK